MKAVMSKKTGIYSVVIKTGKGIKSISTGSKDKAQAMTLARKAGIPQIEAAAKVGKLNRQALSKAIDGRNITVAKVLPEWEKWMRSVGQSPRTCSDNVIRVNAWVSSAGLGGRSPDEIDEEAINRWVNAENGNKAGTRRGELGAIRSFFKYCNAKGWCAGNPAALVRINFAKLTHEQKETRQRKPFSEAAVDRLLNNTEGFWKTAVAIGRHTGLRLGDICKLEWSCFAKRNRIAVWTDKRDARVELPLTCAEAKVWLKEQGIEMTAEMKAHYQKMEVILGAAISSIPAEDTTYCFPKEQRKAADTALRSYFSVMFSRLCASLDLTGHSFHDLRATYATEARRMGIPMPNLANAMGHASTRTTEGYVKG